MLTKLLVLYLFLQLTSPKDHRTLFDSKHCGYVQTHSGIGTSPWLASIRAVKKHSLAVFTVCAGALINQKYVVTSAKCLLNKEFPVVLVQLLAISYDQNVTAGSNVTKTLYGIQDKIIHPSCKPKACLDNIGLLRLNRLVHYTEFLQPICLPYHRSVPVVGSTVYTSIWGPITSPSFPRSKKNVPSSLTTNDNIITTMAWSNSSNEICDAHLGAPLMFQQNNQFYLFGILLNANRNNCELSYLNIFNYLTWVKENVYSNDDPCKTPENETGWCVPLDKCPALVHALANPKEKYEHYLRKYICSNNVVGGFQVCCPKSINSAEIQAESTNLNSLSNKKFCGYQHRDDYISNDTTIAIDEYPWLSTIYTVAADRFDDHNQGSLIPDYNVTVRFQYNICYGSLINNRYVITSAYCLKKFTPHIVSVRLGEYNLLTETDCVSPEIGTEDCNEIEDFGVEKVIVHPFYNSWTNINDIALIRLNTTVLFSEFIRPICLPIPSLFKAAQPDDDFYATGFTHPKMWSKDYLKKKVYYTWIENEVCQNQRKQPITPYQMCLLPKAMPIDRAVSCYHDDGAPAMISNKNQWTLEGVISEKETYCEFNRPNNVLSPGFPYIRDINRLIVLSKISSYLPWIRENIKD